MAELLSNPAFWSTAVACGVAVITALNLRSSNRNFARTLKHQENILEHERRKDRRDAIEDEKQRRREAYAKFYEAFYEQLQSLTALRLRHDELRQVVQLVQAGQLPVSQQHETEAQLILAMKGVDEKTQAVIVPHQLFLCVFPDKYISERYKPLWAKMPDAARDTLSGRVWTAQQWQELTQMFFLWSQEQIEIIRRTGEE